MELNVVLCCKCMNSLLWRKYRRAIASKRDNSYVAWKKLEIEIVLVNMWWNTNTHTHPHVDVSHRKLG
jgi:hypothetical protein